LVVLIFTKKGAHHLKRKGAQKFSYFNCWASLPSPAFFQYRNVERGGDEKILFVRSLRCALAVGHTTASSSLRSALTASLAAPPTSQFVMTWSLCTYYVCWIVELQGSDFKKWRCI